MSAPVALGKRATKQFCRLIKGMNFNLENTESWTMNQDYICPVVLR